MLDEVKQRRKRTIEDEISQEKRQKKPQKIEEGVRIPKKGKSGFYKKRKKTRKDLFTR